MTVRRGSVGLVAVVVLAAGLAACGSDASAPPPRSVGVPGRVTLPPPDGRRYVPTAAGTIPALYDPVLADQGVRITRAAPIDQRGLSYEVSEEADFLALYTRPTSAEGWTPDRYAEAMVPLVGLFARDVFTRWPGLDGFDVCLEPATAGTTPTTGGDDATVWQVTVHRVAVDDVDWEGGALDGLLAAADGDGGISVVVHPPVDDAPAFQEAVARVGSHPGRSTPGYTRGSG